MTLFVGLNGPKHSGKSTVIAPMLVRSLEQSFNVVIESFAKPIKEFIAQSIGEPYHELNKERPRAVFRGRSVREAVIHLSDHYMKERYGNDIFGRLLLERVQTLPKKPDIVIIDDNGFPEEFGVLYPRYLVHVYRRDCSFEGDSRNYHGAPDYVMANNGDLHDAQWECQMLAEDIKRRIND